MLASRSSGRMGSRRHARDTHTLKLSARLRASCFTPPTVRSVVEHELRAATSKEHRQEQRRRCGSRVVSGGIDAGSRRHKEAHLSSPWSTPYRTGRAAPVVSNSHTPARLSPARRRHRRRRLRYDCDLVARVASSALDAAEPRRRAAALGRSDARAVSRLLRGVPEVNAVLLAGAAAPDQPTRAIAAGHTTAASCAGRPAGSATIIEQADRAGVDCRGRNLEAAAVSAAAASPPSSATVSAAAQQPGRDDSGRSRSRRQMLGGSVAITAGGGRTAVARRDDAVGWRATAAAAAVAPLLAVPAADASAVESRARPACRGRRRLDRDVERVCSVLIARSSGSAGCAARGPRAAHAARRAVGSKADNVRSARR